MADPLFILVPLLYAGCFSMLAYMLLRGMQDASRQYESVYAEATARELENLFLFIPPHRIAHLARIAAALAFMTVFLLLGDIETAGGMLRGLLLGGVAAIAVMFMPSQTVKFLRHRRLFRFNQQLVEALMGMSNALRAGFSIQQAIETVVKENNAPISQEFSVFLQQLRVGVRFEDAMKNLEERVDSEDLTLMCRSVEIARQSGGNLTEVFEKIAETIRERFRIEGRIKALTAMGRLQGLVVGLIPVFLLFVMTAIDPRMMKNFFSSTMGVTMLSMVIAMEVIGFLVIRKITKIDV
jgi:tight adherence protein B